LIISDTLAALVGKKVANPTENGKSIEGSVAFCVSAIMIGILSYTFHSYSATFMNIIIAAIVTTLVEYHADKLKINDNLAIPVIFGLILTVL
jgi:dolichol kinase